MFTISHWGNKEREIYNGYESLKQVSTLLKKSFIAQFSTQVANILIECSVTFTKSDGKTLPDTAKTVGPCNNALHSLFSSVRLSINDQLVTLNNSQFYPYKAYFSNLLTYSTDSKLSHLLPHGWATGTWTNVQRTNVIIEV